jgi:RNA polymerase sigma-70 factor (ECF subfamily)
MPKTLSDTEAVELFNRGDERGFQWFWEKYYANLCFFSQRFIVKIGYDYVEAGQIAKDLVCESFMRVFVKATTQKIKFRNYKIVKAYLYSAAMNASKDRLKEEVRTKKLPPPKETEDFNMEYALIESETYCQLARSIDGLPPECKKVITLLYINGKTLDETASILNRAVSTIKNQRARGIELIRARFPQITQQYSTPCAT